MPHPVDQPTKVVSDHNCLASVLGQDVELTDEFKANYQTWLQREVYNTEIQWELLLEDVENPKSQFTI